MSLWGELRRRSVVKVAAAYAIVSWLLVQIADTVFPAFGAPGWVLPVFIVLLVMGFVVALFLSWAYELTPEGVKPTQAVSVPENGARATGRKLDFLIIGVMAAAIVYLAVDNYVLQGGDTAASAGVSETAQTPAFLPNSVAVLPLENLSPEPDNAYVAAGLHEEILNQLAKLTHLNVIARTSVLPYAENRPPIAEIARTLNVQSVMEGSIRYAGNRIRVTTQLIDSTTGLHLWSETYDREFDDIFAIESDIAMNVANALEAEFSVEEQARIERPPTDTPLAYSLLLQATSLVGVGDQAPRMHELLDRAIGLDPNFAAAYGSKAGLFSAELTNTSEGSARDPAELEPLIREYVDKALALDPDTSSALIALARTATVAWRWSEAREASRRAYALTGSSEFDNTWFWSWSGDGAEALRIATREIELNPVDWRAHFTRAVALNYAKDYVAAAAAFHEGIALAPTFSLQHSWLGITEIALGNTDAAGRELRLAEQLLGENRSIVSLLDIAYGYRRIGDDENADRLRAEVTAAAGAGQSIGAGGRALLYLAAGDYDGALGALRQGAAKAKRHEHDAGFYSLMNLKLNYSADSMLEQRDFVDVRNSLRGD